MTAQQFDLILTRARELSPSVRELTLARVDERPFDFEPGQWVNLMVPTAEGVKKRAYSIASAPDGTSAAAFAVTRVDGGPASEHLHAMQQGEVVTAHGPNGLFTRAPGDPSAALFVATGTGITPLRSMMRSALSVRSEAPLWLLFGVRREQDIIYRDELETWASEHPNVQVFITLSQADDGWDGRRGYVQTHLPELFAQLTERAPAPPHVYICGLQRMVKVVRKIAREQLGVDRARVHQERFD